MNDMKNAQDNLVKPKSWKLMLIAFVFLGSYLFAIPQLIRTLILAIIFVPLFGIRIPTLQKKFYKWTIK
jgi:hypothetical protein